MPQLQLPIFPDQCTLITSELAFQRCEDTVVYFNGHLPVFSHAIDDIASFRLFTSQLCINGSATQPQIVRAFGVPLVTVKRMCAKLRAEGPEGFFVPRPRREGSRLTRERLTQAQRMLDSCTDVSRISTELGVLPTTLHKAIADGRLKKSPAPMRTKPISQPQAHPQT